MVRDLRKFFYLSLSVHVGVCLVFITSSTLLSNLTLFKKSEIVWVELPKGVGDVPGRALQKAKDLPKTTIQEQKNAEPSLTKTSVKKNKAPVPAVKKKEAPKTITGKKEKKKELSEFDKRIQAALDKASKAAQTEKATVIPESAQIPDAPLGGYTAGSENADPTRIAKLEDIYGSSIKPLIYEAWIIPAKYEDPSLGLKGDMILYIDETGKIVRFEWKEKSGVEPFDSSVERAIMKVQQVPPPPEELRQGVFYEGIMVHFQPQ